MPTNRKRTRRQSQAQPWQAEYMLTGCVKRADGSNSCKPYLAYPEFDGCFANNLRPAWDEARAELMPQWIREHPGTRPFAWWSIDAPEPRREGETQPEYLKRHELLTKTEKKLLKNQL